MKARRFSEAQISHLVPRAERDEQPIGVPCQALAERPRVDAGKLTEGRFERTEGL